MSVAMFTAAMTFIVYGMNTGVIRLNNEQSCAVLAAIFGFAALGYTGLETLERLLGRERSHARVDRAAKIGFLCGCI